MPADDNRSERKTPYGSLYEPRTFAVQIILLFGAFLGGPAVGWFSGVLLSGQSQVRQLFLCIPPTLVFFLGYALWAARLAAIAFDTIGKSILLALFNVLVRRKRPARLEDVLPDRDKLERMAVRAQKAGWSFLTVAIFVGLGAAALFAFVYGLTSAATIAVCTLLWGYLLGRLARRGYLPLPEPSD
jgi:hypothetical protein